MTYTIIDIGSAWGGFIDDMIKSYNKDVIIYGFEPNLEYFDNLKNRFKNDKNITILKNAISCNEGIFTFNITEFGQCSSLKKPDKKGLEKIEIPECVLKISKNPFSIIKSYDVKTIRLDNFISKNNLEIIDFLKIDAQGHDLEVIKSLGDKLKDVKQLVAEAPYDDCNFYEGSHSRSELVDYMTNHNFYISSECSQTNNQEVNIIFNNDNFDNFIDIDSQLIN